MADTDNNNNKVETFEDEPPSARGPPSRGQGPPQRQHKYSTADMKPENPWKKICCAILTCLICIAIMVVITILMQILFNPPEDEDWTDDAVNATDDDLVGKPGELSGTALLMPKTMDYLEDVCSEDRLHREEKAACEEACGPADECCNPFKNGNSTCFLTEPSGCYSYAKCHSLDGFLDPAHNDLDRVCARASLEIDPTECQLACSAVQCCYTQEESCVASQFQACMDYSACQNLKPDSIDVAPTDLDKRCDEQSPTCKRDCREALCCSDPNSDCFRDNFIACLSYASCTGNSDTTITLSPIYTYVKPAPAILEDICSIKGFAEFGTAKCLEACAPVQCCFERGAGGCFGADPLGCLEYQRCTIFQSPPYDKLSFPPTHARPAVPAVTKAPIRANATAPSVAPVVAGGNATAGKATAAPSAAVKTNTAARRIRH